MKLDILGLEAFVAIAEEGHFGRAAEALHLTQTALTRRLQNLEDLLGVKLVERTTRSVELTVVGRDFLPRGRRLLADLAAALTEIRETGKAKRGDVAIACVPTAGVQFLPSVIQEYATRYPQNRIQILDHSSSGVAESVLRREAEFGVNIDVAHHPDLTASPLLQDRFVLACRDDHPLARKKSLAWTQLGPFPLIVAGEASGNRPLLETALETEPLALRAHYEVQRSSTALGLVAAGVAAAVVPSLAIQKGAYPRIRVVPLTDPVVSRTLVLVVRKASQLSPAARGLYDAILARARSSPTPAR
jgi:DNA-binding transcriptional LysR family regulator